MLIDLRGLSYFARSGDQYEHSLLIFQDALPTELYAGLVAMKHEDVHLASAKGVGNQIILYGARTGGDGIGGVSVLASETFDEGGPTKRPSVQVGDPFMEKLLIECTLEVLGAGLVEGIQDLGGAGISCATSELAISTVL